MNFNLRTHETIILCAGLLGLLEQEAVRVLLGIEPNSLMSGGFITLILGSIGVGTIRNVSRRNGDDSK